MKIKRVKRRKFNFKKFFKFLLFLCVLIFIIYYISQVPIKNIVIKGTNYLTDEEIIETAKLENYPSFVKTLSSKTEKKIKSLSLVKNALVKKKWGFKLEIIIEEYKVLFQIRSSGEYVLDTLEKVTDLDINRCVPVLINYVPDETLDKMLKRFSRLDEDVIVKISEIEYTPTTFDNDRFLLYMNDGNEVYITLTKVNELDNYNKIRNQLGDKKGILYLDSGNYFEIKE